MITRGSCIIDPTARIGHGVEFGRSCHVSKHAQIGGGTGFGDRCRVGENAMLGSDCSIGRSVWIGNDVTIGANVEIDDHVIHESKSWDYAKFFNQGLGELLLLVNGENTPLAAQKLVEFYLKGEHNIRDIAPCDYLMKMLELNALKQTVKGMVQIPEAA